MIYKYLLKREKQDGNYGFVFITHGEYQGRIAFYDDNDKDGILYLLNSKFIPSKNWVEVKPDYYIHIETINELLLDKDNNSGAEVICKAYNKESVI